MLQTLISYWLIAMGLAGLFLIINLYLDYLQMKKKGK